MKSDTGQEGASQCSGSSQVFDRDGLFAPVGGDLELAAELIGLFVEEDARLLDELRAAIAQGESRRIEALAHRRKGTALTIGAPGTLPPWTTPGRGSG